MSYNIGYIESIKTSFPYMKSSNYKANLPNRTIT